MATKRSAPKTIFLDWVNDDFDDPIVYNNKEELKACTEDRVLDSGENQNDIIYEYKLIAVHKVAATREVVFSMDKS